MTSVLQEIAHLAQECFNTDNILWAGVLNDWKTRLEISGLIAPMNFGGKVHINQYYGHYFIYEGRLCCNMGMANIPGGGIECKDILTHEYVSVSGLVQPVELKKYTESEYP